MDSGGMSDEDIKGLLTRLRTIAVVGLSTNPEVFTGSKKRTAGYIVEALS